MKRIKSLFEKREAFSMPELIIGMAILGVVLIITLTSFSKHLELSIENKQKTLATHVARDQLEYLKSVESTNFDQIVTGTCGSINRPLGSGNPTWETYIRNTFPGLAFDSANTTQTVTPDPTFLTSLKQVTIVVTYYASYMPGGKNSITMSSYIRK